MLDKKFRRFIGLDFDGNKEIYSICNVDSVEEIKFSDGIKLIRDYFFGVYLPVNVQEGLKGLYRLITSLENYKRDFDIACFMLIGSSLSKSETTYFYVDSKLPFDYKKENDVYITGSWCHAYKECMKADCRKYYFSLNNIRTDEEKRVRNGRYSYSKMRGLRKALEVSIAKDMEELNKLRTTKKQLDNTEKRKKDVFTYTTNNSSENYLILDMTMGLSLTVILYHYLRDRDKEIIYSCKPIIKELVKLRCFNFRNLLADNIFSYIKNNDFSDSCIDEMTDFLQAVSPKISKMYSYCLTLQWNIVLEVIKEEGSYKIWKDAIKDNIFSIYIDELHNQKYEDELERDEEAQRGLDHIPDKDWDIENWIKLVEKYKIYDLEELVKTVKDANEEKWNKKEDRRSNNSVKTKIDKYTKIHEFVMNFTLDELLI